MSNPRTYVEAPPVTPLPYGLLSAALVLDDLTGNRALGVQYEPAYCGPAYDSLGACEDPVDFGTLTVSVSTTRVATITASGYPVSSYTIDWGDDTITESADPTGDTHTYAAPGTYVVLVTDDTYGYLARVTVTVTAATATGPFTGEVEFSKVPTDGIDLVDGAPFNLYHLFQCSPVGLTPAEMQDRARAALRLGEQRALERVTGTLLANHQDAVDITPTPGTAVHPVIGLAALEKFAASNYGGIPVVHTPRDVGTLLTTFQSVLRSGARLETVQGALVASGGGYDALTGPQAVAAGDGEAWLYITGQVVVRRAPTIEVGPVMSRTPAVNVASMLTERLAIVTWECVTAAVLVSLESAP